ncbi:MAG: hypothetical protein WC821_00510 [archaeon]|jgi:hypothetical protein
MNQKGQAFSVFELMIAGVVAFAILIVLLTVISGFGFNPQNNPKDAIIQGLKTAGISGSTTTQVFSMEPGQTLLATNFAAALGYDVESVYFCKSEKVTNASLTVNEADVSGDAGTNISTVKWSGATKQKFLARVVCETTADLIDSAADAVSAGCEDIAGYCLESQPCCAVIFEKGQ